jgi:hypothetical protein
VGRNGDKGGKEGRREESKGEMDRGLEGRRGRDATRCERKGEGMEEREREEKWRK